MQTVSCDDFLPRTHAHSHTQFLAARMYSRRTYLKSHTGNDTSVCFQYWYSGFYFGIPTCSVPGSDRPGPPVRRRPSPLSRCRGADSAARQAQSLLKLYLHDGCGASCLLRSGNEQPFELLLCACLLWDHLAWLFQGSGLVLKKKNERKKLGH